ncbi:MAG: class I SAM-dependent methyltransferase [Candidatus Aminicenantaceae bacterium]
MNKLEKQYQKDNLTWDQCAEIYERQIVGGHPDIAAFENFEEDFLDKMLRFLGKSQKRPIKLMDIGCGSGRLHLRYAAKTIKPSRTEKNEALQKFRYNRPFLAYDDILAESLSEVWGIDFSKKMIELARKKMNEAGLDRGLSIKTLFKQGSAFQLEPQPKQFLPVAVCLVNSISVMQGPEGAQSLFKAMRRAVEPAGGIAIISNYQSEFVESHALGQYESTMDVSGQPWWMKPDTYASGYKLIPKKYKRSYCRNPRLTVDVYDEKQQLVEKDFILERDPERTRQTVETGHIRTHTNYQSHWYGYAQMEEWAREHWRKNIYHFPTADLDMIRADAAQFTILDSGDWLKSLFQRWKLT